MNNLIDGLKEVSDDKLKAAHALNLCTVSVSQIVDYNDVYILEQEYDAILNNLNLEVIPKDEPLLKTLTEILNTVTFFRIQEIKKKQLEKEYQQRIKNAIWSAVPSLSVIVSGSPIAIAMALATQIGTGYMNYRKEKNNAIFDKEKANVELQITAIEQLNSLRRELFTTAWRLADKYDFPDCLRLTEKQIKQYNAILQDQDQYRKYARLEAIQSKFFAYPPFWYFFAHTALFIATSTNDNNIKENYFKKAYSHFEVYQKINKFNILREDQLAASANLEYVDLLLLDNTPDYRKICEIIDAAVEKSGNANDVLQLCAIAYMRCGNSESAVKLLKILINEDYNAISNAKIVSKLYVSQYISSKNMDVYSNYKILETRVDSVYLFPMPTIDCDNEKALEEHYISKQKALLKKQYRNSLNAYAKKAMIEFNAVIPAPVDYKDNRENYYGYTLNAKEQRAKDVKKVLCSKQAQDYKNRLSECGFKIGFIKQLNNTVADIEKLDCFKALDNHDRIIKLMEAKIRTSKIVLCSIQKKMDDGNFDFEDYIKLVNNYSYKTFTENFFDIIKEKLTDYIDNISDLSIIEKFDDDLMKFCNDNNLPSPDSYVCIYKEQLEEKNGSSKSFFSYKLLGETEEDNDSSDEIRNKMQKKIKDSISDITKNDNVRISFVNDAEFTSYMENKNLKIVSGTLYSLRQRAVAIIDDITKRNLDLIFCIDGIYLVSKNAVRECVRYKDVEYKCQGNVSELILGYPDEYANKNINIDILYSIIRDLNSSSKTSNI